MQLRSRRDQTSHFTKSRAVAFNFIWELVKLPSPVRDHFNSHLRGKQSSLADNKQPCDDNIAQTSSLLTEQADKFIPSTRNGEFSKVFCYLQVWTDVCRKKITLLQISFFLMCCSAAPSVLTGAKEEVEVGLQS